MKNEMNDNNFPLPSSNSHKHKEVIQTNGPGFTKVEVREYFDGNDDGNSTDSTVRNDSPVLFTNSRRNLKRQSTGHPMKIFSGNFTSNASHG
jgi:hypothetical protein